MKLQKELQPCIETAKGITNLQEYAKWLKEKGDYNDFTTRLAWDLIRVVYQRRKKRLVDLYDEYNCNDTHMDTLAKAVLKAVYIDE